MRFSLPHARLQVVSTAAAVSLTKLAHDQQGHRQGSLKPAITRRETSLVVFAFRRSTKASARATYACKHAVIAVHISTGRAPRETVYLRTPLEPSRSDAGDRRDALLRYASLGLKTFKPGRGGVKFDKVYEDYEAEICTRHEVAAFTMPLCLRSFFFF